VPHFFSSRCGSGKRSLPICWCESILRFDRLVGGNGQHVDRLTATLGTHLLGQPCRRVFGTETDTAPNGLSRPRHVPAIILS
jgi:hypothetical protein